MANDLALPGVKLPALPTVEMFASELRVHHYDSGNVNWDVYVNPRRHIPRQHCNAILAELEAANVPAPKPVAARLAKLLIGSYPARELSDPEIFVSVVTHTFASYPPDIGIAAVDDLTRGSKWLPTRADIVEACDKRVTERSYAAHVVQKHLERHDENDRHREMEKQRLAERAKRYDENPHWRVFDRWAQLFRVYRQHPELEWRLKAILEEFGEAAVDDMHRQLLDLDPVPSCDAQMQRELFRLMQARRGARSDEVQP